MALVVKDRVQETSTTTGTGTFTLSGAVSGFQSFSAIGNGNTTYYTITDGTNWEVGIGTYTSSGTTLSRDTVLKSSNSNNLVNFGAGSKFVFCTYPADKSVYADASNKVSGYAIENSTIGATTATTGAFTSVTTPSVTATTNDLTLSAISTGNFNVNTPNGTAFKVLPVTATSSNWLQVGNPTTTVIRLSPAGTSVCDFRINSQSFTSFYTGSSADGLGDGANQMRVSHTASAVNYVQVTGAATGTGNSPTISSQGSDTDVNLTLAPKGAALFRVTSGVGGSSRFSIDNGGVTNLGISGSGGSGFRVSPTTSQVNFYSVSGSIAGLVPVLTTGLSSDTNVSMAFQSKGTGAIDLAAGSSGVNISNGNTVTAITRTVQGSNYTSVPSLAISAPTTAGGVQATATANLGVLSATIVSGGTGYTAGDTLTVVGGTGTAAQLTVSTVSSGVITAVTVATQNGVYSVFPTNNVSVTGGTGSGATFTISGGILSTFTITAAGSGYIEQPTITFSGGGSGAAAYASVGSGTTIQTLGSSLTLQTPSLNTNNTFIQLKDDLTNPASQTGFYVVGASSGLGRLALRSSKALYVSSGSSNNISFTTGSSATVDGSTQFTVANTTSAVNYVQVTGGATGGTVQVTAQGSDVAVGLQFVSKSASIIFVTRSGNARSFNILDSASPVNYLQVQGNTAGVAPILSAQGTDTDIDLALTPKGAGNVRFGTYTASVLTPTGYVTIKDSGGTTRRLLVG